VRHEVARLRVDARIGGSADVVSVVPGLCSWPVPTLTCVVGHRSAGSKLGGEAEGRPFHPGATGEGKAGRVNRVNLRGCLVI
jgi:hypothetical protein